MDDQILATLYAADSDPVAERLLAQKVGMSIEVLREHIETLRKLSFVIEEHPQRGYRLIKSPDLLIADDLRARILAKRGFPSPANNSNYIGNKILVFEKISSTNDMVQRLAVEGHPEGLVVFAESQSDGRGREGREWVSPSHKGLWFTVLLRPQCDLSFSSRLTVLSAVAIATALRRLTGLPLRIKWPNDIFCNARKLAGILVELDVTGGKIRYAAIGMGIDVNMDKSDFPDPLKPLATSLKLEAAKSFHRPTLAADILTELEYCCHFLTNEKFPKLLERWLELDETIGRQISILQRHGGKLRGLASSLDTDGALLVRTDQGRIERVIAGDVTLEHFDRGNV